MTDRDDDAELRLLQSGHARQVRFRLAGLALTVVLAGAVAVAALAKHTAPTVMSDRQKAKVGILDPKGPLPSSFKRLAVGVRGLMCLTCNNLLIEALARRPGVLRVRVQFQTGSAQVDFDPLKTTAVGVLAAFNAAGYPAQAWTEPQDMTRDAVEPGADHDH